MFSVCTIFFRIQAPLQRGILLPQKTWAVSLSFCFKWHMNIWVLSLSLIPHNLHAKIAELTLPFLLRASRPPLASAYKRKSLKSSLPPAAGQVKFMSRCARRGYLFHQAAHRKHSVIKLQPRTGLGFYVPPLALLQPTLFSTAKSFHLPTHAVLAHCCDREKYQALWMSSPRPHTPEILPA